MKNIVLLAFSCLFIACSTPPSMENTVKKYMTDSVVPRFNDPSSYQFVSMKVDTFTGKDYIHNIRALYVDTLLFSKDKIAEEQAEATSLEKRPGYSDSVIDLEVTVDYRGKNKLGALILDHLNLTYYPVQKRFVPKPQ